MRGTLPLTLNSLLLAPNSMAKRPNKLPLPRLKPKKALIQLPKLPMSPFSMRVPTPTALPRLRMMEMTRKPLPTPRLREMKLSLPRPVNRLPSMVGPKSSLLYRV
jgi:hypothetical protein